MPVTVSSAATGALAAGASAATVQAALEALAPIGTGNVAVTKIGTTFTITFQGALAGVDVPLLRLNSSALTGVTAATIDETTPGASGVNEVQRLVIAATGGTFVLTALAISAQPNEITMALRWVEATLRGDTVITALVGTNIYADAPGAAPALSVVYANQINADNVGNGNERINVLASIAVKGVARSAAYNNEVTALARRIDELFNQQNNVILADGTVATVSRTATIAYDERASGTLYKHLGATFEMVLQQ